MGPHFIAPTPSERMVGDLEVAPPICGCAMKHERFVIIGASLAGASAAAALREGGFDGTVELIGAEPQPPYNRPPLSKGSLRGQERCDDQLVNPADYYAGHDINLRLGVRVTVVDPRRKVVGLDGGEEVPYDRLLVATGGRNRTLTTPGAQLPGIFSCARWRIATACAVARSGARAVVIGSVHGSRCQASLRQMGSR